MDIAINNPKETESLAKIIGLVAEPSDTIILSGDLGAGKTTMTKGIALGLGIDQMIKSPTYTIIREYQQGRMPLYHMDVYRIENGADDLGLDEYFEGDGLSVVEWGKLLGEFLPTDYLDITITKDPQVLEKRVLSFQAFGKRAENYLDRIKKKMEDVI
ncbi:tRNA (adenosine(37)-N6)-threonylcarbamoyltransferase complex ATPase subunit type 1 TsaE [Enterococcus plantarum]|uniref:tRNA (adenosine(37)-N6)-threonylcarbamoyltransferase complex ATPase subunit type 1 TsaE n=1 Tax=Enterococcus plantarum TaxID=1077675 RepID=UPI00084CF1C2|nr:tRNA (adenosine(37)-N6)-threonylcarbamoyltransferase complex ATPase subunit type 1 TsaE [Enterococcus plantarum]OEG14594.1 tRNA (adenosine(37)-N6)-threonylcarbamoyltransferase complex ATPase subunit type 1 TsaE [Enterococcus plantarum]